MGREGAVLCHCLYAWAVSYGVDETGQLDVPEGTPLGPVSLASSGDSEAQRQAERQRRMEKTHRVVRTILREIDEYGILRRPSWDGVRVLLLIIPLTEGEFHAVVSLQLLTHSQDSPRQLNGRPCTRALCLKYSCSVPCRGWVMTGALPPYPRAR